MYEVVLSKPPLSEWNERGGTVCQILKVLGMSRGSRTVVARVIKEVDDADKKGIDPDFLWSVQLFREKTYRYGRIQCKSEGKIEFYKIHLVQKHSYFTYVYIFVSPFVSPYIWIGGNTTCKEST